MVINRENIKACLLGMLSHDWTLKYEILQRPKMSILISNLMLNIDIPGLRFKLLAQKSGCFLHTM
jgi:hypothetical protein